MKIILFIFILILISESAFSQQRPARTDTIHIYENIESYSKRNKVTRYIYGLIFEPYQVKPENKGVIKKTYNTFEGKIIRKINIETLDPFGYSITDTAASPQDLLSKTGDKLHIKSRRTTIRNLLLIHKNQRFDSLLVVESERLVRSRNFVRDVSFYVRPTTESSDSVDIFIRELDRWSLIPEASAASSSQTVNFTEQNFIGLGDEFNTGFTKYLKDEPNTFSANYFIPNIRNTYISSTLYYRIREDNTFKKSVAVDRPFYSPLARWAGGVYFASQFKKLSMMDDNSIIAPIDLKYKTQDYWAGYSYQIFKGNTENERTTNLIVTARYLRLNYFKKPSESFDTLHYYSNEDFYLTEIGLSTRKYVQDKYVFKYGVTEYVPIGRVYALTGGYQIKNNTKRSFLGARFSVGNYNPWGYLSSSFEYESFFLSSKAEEGIFNADVKYFTKLLEIGKWKFRQFVEPHVTIGINRFDYDSLTLNDGFGLNGFRSNRLSGTSRLLLSFQTQAYAPWNFIGFRFGPFFTYSLGMLGNDKTGFKNNKVYSHIGLGVLLKNEHLIFNSFQLSLSFYPMIPGNGQNVYKMNSFETTDFGLSDFEIGKPSPMVFK